MCVQGLDFGVFSCCVARIRDGTDLPQSLTLLGCKECLLETFFTLFGVLLQRAAWGKQLPGSFAGTRFKKLPVWV